MSREQMIRSRLEQALSPSSLTIEDESRYHEGHAGSMQGAGHYAVTLVSEAFSNQTMVKRHQLIYAALGEMIPNEIHALKIKAFSPEESAP